MDVQYERLWQVLTDHFRLGDWSIHGPVHWRTVERHALALAKQNGADETTVRLFAVFHDAERMHESSDPEHGFRAEELVRTMHGDLFALSPRQLDDLCLACRLHNHGQTTDEVTIGTCWDADRFDLPRVGIRPDPNMMSTEQGKLLARQGTTPLSSG